MAGVAPGPPPLRPFGLVLHRDGRFSHEGQAIRNRKLRALFERSVAYLPDEDKYVVRAGRFRGQIEVEEAGFFVRSIDPASGCIALSDRSEEELRPETLTWSALDPDVLLCRVKHALREGGVPARFERSAQAELLLRAEERGGRIEVAVAGRWTALPDPR